METLTTNAVPNTQLERVDALTAQLPEGSALRRSLSALSESLRSGHDVVIGRGDRPVTPAAAADMLGMSRTHLYKLLDEGAIPFVRVGRDRRMDLADVLAYDARRQASRKALAERFAHQDRSRDALLAEIARHEVPGH